MKRSPQAATLEGLSQVRRKLPTAAIDPLPSAANLFDEVGRPEAAGIRERLAELTGAKK